MPTAEVLAREALRLADAEPQRALEAAREADALANAERSTPARVIAARARGLALFSLGDLDESLAELGRAIRLARRRRLMTLAAEARMTQAWVLTGRGHGAGALRAIGLAVNALDGVEHARALAQRGTILHQLGRFDDALIDYGGALPLLEDVADLRWMAQVRLNRGIGHAHRGALDLGVTDLEEAGRLSAKLGLTLWEATVQHNLGYVEVLRGDIPRALGYFNDAETTYRSLGSHAGVGNLLRDRAELLLSAGLLAEARQAAEEAVKTCQAERRRAALAECQLVLARVLELQGDVPAALVHARGATTQFRAIGHRQMAALGQLTVTTFLIGAGGRLPGSARLDAVIEACGGLWPNLAVEARLRGAMSAAERRHPARERELLEQVGGSRYAGTALVRARAWYAHALLRLGRGDRRGAQAALRRGLAVLDDYAAVLGATEIRARVSSHRFDLAALGVRVALEGRSAEQVLRWSERARASHLQRTPGRPPNDPELVTLLAELRLINREIEERQVQGQPVTTLTQRRGSLESRARDRTRTQRAAAGAPLGLPSIGELTLALGDVALVEYIAIDNVLNAVTLVDGRVRRQVLGPVSELVAVAERLPFALHRLARRQGRPAGRAAALTLLAQTARDLDARMLRPLRELGDRPLLIVPTLALQWLPWSVLPSCAGRPMTIAPSATSWYAGVARSVASDAVVVAAGPGLSGAEREAAAVAAVYGVQTLVGPAATATAVSQALDGAAVGHLAAHGRVRRDNPLFGSLRLWDGPLMMYDLEQLSSAPHTVVVAACDAGRPMVPVGDELLGLTATLLSRGTAQLVASVVPVLDLETAPLMTELHRCLAAGEAVAPALAKAQLDLAGRGPEGVATAAGFLCFGAGFVAPLPQHGAAARPGTMPQRR